MIFVGLSLDLIEELFGGDLVVFRSLKQSLVLLLKSEERVLCRMKLEFRSAEGFVGAFDIAAELFGVVEPELYVCLFLRIEEGYRTLSLFGFFLERSYLCRDLEKDVVYPDHIVFGL